MIPRGIEVFAVPLARSLFGFIAALLLCFAGDLAARVFNLAVGYSWPQEVHRHIYFVSIGVGAGVGAYLGWINLNHPRRLMVGILLLVIAGGVLGVYLARAYSPGQDPSYWWSRFATDTRVYLGGALAAVILATAIGVIGQVVTSARFRSRYHSPQNPEVWRLNR